MALTSITLPGSFEYVVASVDKSSEGSDALMTITLVQSDPDSLTLANQTPVFVQTEQMTEDGIACLPYGAYIIGAHVLATYLNVVLDLNGTIYKYGASNSDKITFASVKPGDKITVYNTSQA